MGDFPGGKKLSLSKELQLAQEIPRSSLPVSVVLCTYVAPQTFFKLTPSETRRNQHRRRSMRRGGVPQQQRKASWLALPAQKGEDTSGHVELSYVLSRPSPPSSLDFLFDTQFEQARRTVGKDLICKVTASVCHNVQKEQKVCLWWLLKKWLPQKKTTHMKKHKHTYTPLSPSELCTNTWRLCMIALQFFTHSCWRWNTSNFPDRTPNHFQK